MLTLQNNWKAFERWVKRYEKVMKNPESGIHSWNYPELATKPLLTRRQIHSRTRNRIQFLISYLGDIVNDGPEFMKEKGISCLTNQYPSKCEKSFGIWLWMKKSAKAQSESMFFEGRQVSLFAPEPDILDWFSMHQILPFDFIAIRAPHGEPWNNEVIPFILSNILGDLRFDGMTCKMKPCIDDLGILRIDLTDKRL